MTRPAQVNYLETCVNASRLNYTQHCPNTGSHPLETPTQRGSRAMKTAAFCAHAAGATAAGASISVSWSSRHMWVSSQI